jgi:hypothetical protein
VQAIIFLRSTHPLQIPVDDAEVMHILQAIRNICQLPGGLVGHSSGSNTDAYKRSSVCIRVFSNELVGVAIVHPLGNHRKVVFAERHSKQRQDVRMPEMLPGHHLSAISL